MSGIVLLLAALIALAWTNSRWRASYEALWATPLGVRLGTWVFERDLHFWIVDGAMTIFFFVVGLEIKRELRGGELSSIRRAALPVGAALGGMIVPACLFLAFNREGTPARGWGIPMATDIAFALGALATFGKRVRPALRVLLLALAVIDDVGAIVVIACFYSHGIAPLGLAIAGMGMATILGMQRAGVNRPVVYVLPAFVIWAGAYRAGIHPTVAGVAVGLMTPTRESLVERLERALHGWVAYAVMPLFAMASAGVAVSDVSIDARSGSVFCGVLLGLVVGKPIGIVAGSWLCVRTRIALLPSGMTWTQVGLVGMVGGIGFTMALFVAQLAYPPGALLETAKLAILMASASAALISLVIGRFLLSRPPAGVGVTSTDEAGRSTVS